MNFFQKTLKFIANLIFPRKVHGKENIPEGRAVFVSNHLSMIDSVFMLDIADKNLYVLAKKELFDNKFVGWLLGTYGGIPIDRDNPDIKTILRISKLLKEGNKLAVFPEGTRNKNGDGKLLPLKGGSFVFAIKAKCPIVPIYIQKKAKIFRKTHFYIGKPFELSEFYDKKLTQEDFDKISELVADKIYETARLLSQKLEKKEKRKCK